MQQFNTEDGWFGGKEKPGFMAGWQGRMRMQRGDIGPIILHVLGEKPMHGYEIIRTLEARSHGMWRPSAGSVYPTLQLLEEQELVVSKEEQGKKVYARTTKGEEQAKDFPCQSHPWAGKHKEGEHFREVAHTVHEIIGSLKQIAFQGTEEQITEAKAILAETRERLAKLSSAR
jgi:DNA-binding PadR family transcriptional regulator